MRQKDLFSVEPEPWDVDDAADQVVASVVFPEGAVGTFDYLVPESLRSEVEPGRRVRVPLGRGNRALVAYCVAVQNRPAGARRLKLVKAVLDQARLLTPHMLQLTHWMSDYYMCEWGKVIEAVVPAGVRGQAGTRQVTFLSVPTNVAARLTQLKLPAKQAEVLTVLAAAPGPLTPPQLAAAAGCTSAPVSALRKKGLITAQVRRVSRAEQDELPVAMEKPPVLSDQQQLALDAILSALNAGRHETLLVHGVTGSGKTEVYMRAIDELIHFGRQAIVLVPEISLTPQTRRRFRARFDRVAVLHSHLSAAERHGHWQRIARGEVPVVVGARSAVFAPTPHLGMIVLDEEHDASFKQDTAPRYHARDVALRRAEMEQIPLVLGTATPSLETWQRCLEGSCRLVDMPARVFGRPLPQVGTIDLRTEYRDRFHRGAVGRQLHQAIDQSLREGGQVILLLNRRGHSTHIQCPACGKVVRCPDCDLALTHHSHGDKAICHYCDYKIGAPDVCPECGFQHIRYAGLGTQRLETEIRKRFPHASCLRMDSDSMRKPGSHEQALGRFRDGEVQILLGTQMIAKGLDFPNVTLVGVINADTALHLPDFRAAERTFQLVTQVAGRTGRGDKGGRVLVQTFSPDHPAIVAAQHHDYRLFAGDELDTRREFGYPPFANSLRIIVRGSTLETTEQFAQHLTQQIQDSLAQQNAPARVRGPTAAPIAKVRGKHRFHMLLYGPEGVALRKAVRNAADNLKTPADVQWIVDVDPLDML